MLNLIDKLLNHITMYKLLLYYLIALIMAAIMLSLFGVLHYSAMAIVVSTVVLVVTCWLVNQIFAVTFEAPTNVESVYITALILALIISPLTSYSVINISFLIAAGSLAMASKYLLTINKKHLFNPAAVAVALTALGPHQSANWWVGTTALLPYVLIGGLLLARKIRREQMVFTFFLSVLAATTLYSLIDKLNVASSINKTLLTSAMFFLGFVMLTEPLTTPPTARKQTWYAILTGFLFPPQFHIFSLYSTPELALIASNAFAYVLSPKTKLFPVIKQKLRITPDTVDFIFNPGRRLAYQPGQYMEWTLPHEDIDNRGNRRYFTLASSPTEEDIRIGIKFYERSSSYKDAMLDLVPDTPIVASQLAGDFVLPKDSVQKLVFIAGGIGITPFRSMVKYLLDTKQSRSITLLYSARTQKDFAYKDIFEQARIVMGLNVIYAVTDENITNHDKSTHLGRINANLIKRAVPDYKNSLFYISGTSAMVKAMRSILTKIGVPGRQIKVDYFSGYS